MGTEVGGMTDSFSKEVIYLETSFLRAEHAALVELRQQLLNLLERDSPPSIEISALRWRMSRVLLGHLAKEDRHLYPRLKASSHVPTADLAAHHEREMGDLAARWQSFMTDWPTDRIASEWVGFCSLARSILDALANRIDCEERDLYPRLDAMPLDDPAPLAARSRRVSDASLRSSN